MSSLFETNASQISDSAAGAHPKARTPQSDHPERIVFLTAELDEVSLTASRGENGSVDQLRGLLGSLSRNDLMEIARSSSASSSLDVALLENPWIVFCSRRLFECYVKPRAGTSECVSELSARIALHWAERQDCTDEHTVLDALSCVHVPGPQANRTISTILTRYGDACPSTDVRNVALRKCIELMYDSVPLRRCLEGVAVHGSRVDRKIAKRALDRVPENYPPDYAIDAVLTAERRVRQPERPTYPLSTLEGQVMLDALEERGTAPQLLALRRLEQSAIEVEGLEADRLRDLIDRDVLAYNRTHYAQAACDDGQTDVHVSLVNPWTVRVLVKNYSFAEAARRVWHEYAMCDPGTRLECSMHFGSVGAEEGQTRRVTPLPPLLGLKLAGEISPESAETIAPAIRDKGIYSLDLSATDPRSRGAYSRDAQTLVTLIRAGLKNPLGVLLLDSNRIGAVVNRAVSRHEDRWGTTTEQDQNLPGQDARSLADAGKVLEALLDCVPRTLHALSLDRCGVAHDHRALLAEILQKAESLKTIRLGDNNFLFYGSGSATDKLVGAIVKRDPLHLDLSGGTLRCSRDALFQILKGCPGLRALVLDNVDVGAALSEIGKAPEVSSKRFQLSLRQATDWARVVIGPKFREMFQRCSGLSLAYAAPPAASCALPIVLKAVNGPNMTFLDLSGHRIGNHADFVDLAKSGRNLEKLLLRETTLSESRAPGPLFQTGFPKLRVLNLEGCGWLDNAHISIFLKASRPALRFFGIGSGTQVEAETVDRLVRSACCPALREVTFNGKRIDVYNSRRSPSGWVYF